MMIGSIHIVFLLVDNAEEQNTVIHYYYITKTKFTIRTGRTTLSPRPLFFLTPLVFLADLSMNIDMTNSNKIQ